MAARALGAGVVALAASGLAAAPAVAAPPPNDAPQGAVEFTAVTAENGTPTERQGIAEVAEATADPGVAPCLGPDSFARTVWFRVPAATAPRLVEVTGTGGSGQSAAVPDLAAFVVGDGGAPVEPQACDGPNVQAGPAVEGAADVAVRVPAGRSVLIQAGRPADQPPERIVLSSSVLILGDEGSPPGDRALDAPALALGTATRIDLSGATVSEEDPAQPACPASGTVWRRFTTLGSGVQQIRVAGDDATAVTAFVGAVPTADNAVACALRERAGAEIDLSVAAGRGDTVWVRVGTESDGGDAAATLAVGGPGAPVGGPSRRAPCRRARRRRRAPRSRRRPRWKKACRESKGRGCRRPLRTARR